MSGQPPNQYPSNQPPPPEQYPQNQAQPNQYPQPGAYPPNQYPPNQYPPNTYQQNPYYQNPYQQNPYAASTSPYVPCPRCQTPGPQPVKFTWWGGLLGPKLLKHVKCQNCKLAYNGQSGQSNTKGIIIYAIVVNLIVLGLIVIVMVAANS